MRGRLHAAIALLLVISAGMAGCTTTQEGTGEERPDYQVTGGQFVDNVTAENLEDIQERVAGYEGAELALMGGSPPTIYVVRGLRSEADCLALSEELSTVDYLKEVGGCMADNTYEPDDGTGEDGDPEGNTTEDPGDPGNDTNQGDRPVSRDR